MTDDIAGEELALLLAPLASDPGKRDCLHELLGPYCHRGRNHLNSLKLSLYLAKACAAPSCRDLWTDLEDRYQQVELLFDQIQMIYRPLRLNLVRVSLSLLFEDARDCWAERMAQAGRGLFFEPPAESVVGEFDPLLLRAVLDAFVEWRQQFGRAGDKVSLRWTVVNGHFVVEWHESMGEGIHLANRSSNDHDGLALPVLARVVSAHRGTLALSTHQGFQLTMRWPLESDCPGASP